MNPFLRCINWLILLSFTLGSDCPAPAFRRLYIRRHYTTNPQEETLILFKYPYSEESITLKEEYKGETDTVNEFCLATGIQFILRLMDSAENGWSPGSYVTVSTDSEVLYYQLTLLSGGGYADVNFVISPSSSSDNSGFEDVLIILGSSFFVLLISGITGVIVQCVKKKQLKVTDPKNLSKSPPVVIPQQTPPVVIPQQTPPVVIPQQTTSVVIPQKNPPVVIPQQTPPVVIPQKNPPVVIPQPQRVVLPQQRPIMLIPKKQPQIVLQQSSHQVVVPNKSVVLQQVPQQGTPVIISNPVQNGVAPSGQSVVLLRSSLPLSNSGTVTKV